MSDNRNEHDTASRAATEGEMASPPQQKGDEGDTSGQVEAPGPEDTPEPNAPGGDARNQSDRTPGQYGDPSQSTG